MGKLKMMMNLIIALLVLSFIPNEFFMDVKEFSGELNPFFHVDPGDLVFSLKTKIGM